MAHALSKNALYIIVGFAQESLYCVPDVVFRPENLFFFDGTQAIQVAVTIAKIDQPEY